MCGIAGPGVEFVSLTSSQLQRAERHVCFHIITCKILLAGSRTFLGGGIRRCGGSGGGAGVCDCKRNLVDIYCCMLHGQAAT